MGTAGRTRSRRERVGRCRSLALRSSGTGPRSTSIFNQLGWAGCSGIPATRPGHTWLDRPESTCRGVGHGMAPPNLTRVDAERRAALLDVAAYAVELDLTDGSGAPG